MTVTNTNNQIVIEARNVTVEFDLTEYKIETLKEFVLSRLHGKGKTRKLIAVNDVSLSVNRGESIGVIGHNGSGKSTLLKVLAGVMTPISGSVKVHGRIAPLIELGAGFDGELSGMENIRLACLLMGLTNQEIDRKLDSIIDFSELSEFIDIPVKNYSSGMYARLGFACTTAVEPDVLIIDEILAVGDSSFQRKCFTRLGQLRAAGTSVVLVSHSDAAVAQYCERAIVMQRGKVVFAGPADEALLFHEEIMSQRAAAILSKEARAERERQMQLRIASFRNSTGLNAGKIPQFTLKSEMIQDGHPVETLDFAKAFDLVFDITCTQIENIVENLYFGFEFRLHLHDLRVGGFGTEPNVIIPRADIHEGKPYKIIFPFPKGLPNLAAAQYHANFAIHDSEMRRGIYWMTLPVFQGTNSSLGSNFNGDVYSFSELAGIVSIK